MIRALAVIGLVLALSAPPGAAAEKKGFGGLGELKSLIPVVPNRPMQIRFADMTPAECLSLADELTKFFAVFGGRETIAQQKNEAVYSICFMEQTLEVACRPPAEWITVSNPAKPCAPR